MITTNVKLAKLLTQRNPDKNHSGTKTIIKFYLLMLDDFVSITKSFSSISLRFVSKIMTEKDSVQLIPKQCTKKSMAHDHPQQMRKKQVK